MRRFVEFVRIDAPRNNPRNDRRQDRRWDRRRFGRGALSPAVAILAVMIFTLAGLVIDGGRQLGARSRAIGYAQEAARVGAAAIQLNVAEAKIDTAKAATAITEFCGQVRQNDPAVTTCGPTTLTDSEVAIQVDIANKTTFLGLIGKRSLKATGTGRAHAEQGVTEPDESPTIPPIDVVKTPEDPGGPITTAQPPTIDVPCPTWTTGSPTPRWTLSPLPFPRTCTPNATPTDPTTDPSGPPSGSPSDSPSGPPSGPANSAPPRR